MLALGTLSYKACVNAEVYQKPKFAVRACLVSQTCGTKHFQFQQGFFLTATWLYCNFLLWCHPCLRPTSVPKMLCTALMTWEVINIGQRHKRWASFNPSTSRACFVDFPLDCNFSTPLLIPHCFYCSQCYFLQFCQKSNYFTVQCGLLRHSVQYMRTRSCNPMPNISFLVSPFTSHHNMSTITIIAKTKLHIFIDDLIHFDLSNGFLRAWV